MLGAEDTDENLYRFMKVAESQLKRSWSWDWLYLILWIQWHWYCWLRAFWWFMAPDILDVRLDVRSLKVDLSIILLALSDWKSGQTESIKIVINEAVELGKKFSSKDSSKFINGLLDKILNDE